MAASSWAFAGARLVVGAPIGQQRGDVRHRPGVGRQLRGDLAGALGGVVERAGLGQHAQRVVVEGAAPLVLADAGAAPHLDQAARRIERVLARVQRNGGPAQSHAAQGHLKGLRAVGQAPLARCQDLQHDRRSAPLQVLQDGPVGCLGVGLHVALAHVPAAGIPAAAAYRCRVRQRICARVERLDGEPVAGRGHQALLEVGALQDLADQR